MADARVDEGDNEVPGQVAVFGDIRDRVQAFHATADARDWLLAMCLVSLCVQLTVKLIENYLLGSLASALAAAFRGLRNGCRRRATGDAGDRDRVRLQVFVHKNMSVCHLKECQHVMRMTEANRRSLSICQDCSEYLNQECGRIIRNALDEV